MKLILISSLLLAACTKPSLPEPSIQYPKPPAILMEPPEQLKPIPRGNK